LHRLTKTVWDQAIQNFHLIKHSYNPRNPNDHSHLIPIRGILWDTKMDPAVLQTRIQQQGLRLEFCEGYLKLQPELIEVNRSSRLGLCYIIIEYS
jgi:hypothetical protein